MIYAKLTSRQRAVLEKMITGKLIISHPGGFHLPHSAAHFTDGEIVNARTLDALRAAGYIDHGERDGYHSGSACTHGITDTGRKALEIA